MNKFEGKESSGEVSGNEVPRGMTENQGGAWLAANEV